MNSEYSKWFWAECDELNKDTSFAHSLAEKAWNYRQTEVDELNQELHLVLNNWNDLTNAIHARTNGTAVAEARQLYEKVDELQKRVDAVKTLIEEYKDPPTEDRAFRYALSIVAYDLEQTLKGGE